MLYSLISERQNNITYFITVAQSKFNRKVGADYMESFQPGLKTLPGITMKH